MSDINSIKSFIADFSKTKLTTSEANTKTRIIEPLLESLGWNLRSNEVRLEYSVRAGSGTAYVDYALMLEDKPVVLVEAKALSEPLTENYCDQVISYGRYDGTRLNVLTNGRNLKVFNSEEGKTEKDCLLAEINLEKATDRDISKLRKLLSRESVLSGEYKTALEELTATRKAIAKIREKQSELSDKFKEILLTYTSNKLENRVRNTSIQLAELTLKLLEEKKETATRALEDIKTDVRPTLKGSIPLQQSPRKPVTFDEMVINYSLRGLDLEIKKIREVFEKAAKNANVLIKPTPSYMVMRLENKRAKKTEIYLNINPEADHGVWVYEPPLYEKIFNLGKKLGLETHMSQSENFAKIIMFNRKDGITRVSDSIEELVDGLIEIYNKYS